MCKIKIIDGIMGIGKTSFAIQKMKEDTTTNYVYITPFLKEVDRVKKACNNRRFVEPLNSGNGKLDALHSLLKDNRNIVSTHALFRMSTDVTRELIQSITMHLYLTKYAT
jgi:broad-specificity NMP kinase